MPSSPSLSLGLDWQDILRSANRLKYVAVVSAIVLVAAAALGTARMPRIYQAKARLLMEPVLSRLLGEDPGVQELAQQFKHEREFFNTQYQIVVSGPVLQRVVELLKLREDQGFLEHHGLHPDSSDKALIGRLRRSIDVEPERLTQIVEISAKDSDPERAAQIANAVGQAYIDYTLDRRLEDARAASRWLDERVDELAAQLEQQERKLHEFKQRNLLVSVSLEDRQNMTATGLSVLNERMLAVRTELIERKAIREAVLSSSTDAMQAIDLAGSRRGDIISRLRTGILELERLQAQLSSRYGPKHPQMRSVEEQLAQSRRALEREQEIFIEATNKGIEALQESLEDLTVEIAKEKQKALELNSLGLEYSKLTRDIGTTREIYESLLRRQTETDLSQLLKSNFVQWFQRADPPGGPVSPSMIRNVGFGLLAALVLALIGIVLGAFLDQSVHSRSDIEEAMGLPFLGVFPRLPLAKNEETDEVNADRDLFVFRNPQGMAAECARSIRTNLLFMGTARPTKKLLVTSPRAGEGKTTTTIATGIVMAQAGNKVLLIDTDLRRPRLHRAFKVNRSQGLTSILVGGDIDRNVVSTEVPGLDVLPAGPTPPNPAELLHSKRFEEVLEKLGKSYDRILLDSPPIGVVVDAAILSQVVDGTILVTQAEGTTKDSLRRAVSRLREVQAHIVGAVLNYVETRQAQSDYHGYYAATGEAAPVQPDLSTSR